MANYKKSAIKICIWMVGFFVGFVAAFILEALILWLIQEAIGAYRLTPRGIGWITIPLLCGIALGNFAISPKLPQTKIFKTISTKIKSSIWVRAYIGLIAIWAILILFYILMFDPFGYRIDDREIRDILKWFFLPTITLACAMAITKWIVKENTRGLEK
ncbi:MAG: hypothetical protein GC131_04160 [Alphaproteobacteria bacterium]|nr:hypothetical protein [Alphaproteobacteria bacterium]